MSDEAPSVARAPVARFAGLEGLRTIGVLAVLLTHTGFATGVTQRTHWGDLLGHLEIGPAIFFVISAFLLYRPFVAATLRGVAPPSSGSFLRRRAVRVFPAYWLTLAILVSTSQVHVRSSAHLFKLVTLTQIYTHHDFFAVDVWVPTWTLATELTFYGFLVLYAPLLRRMGAALTTVQSRLRLELAGAAILIVFAFVWRVYVYYGPGLPDVAEHWLPGTIDVFALGLAAAAIHAAWTLGEPLPRLVAFAGSHPDWCAVAAFGCYLAVPVLTGVDKSGLVVATGKDAYLRNMFQALCALLLLLPVAFGDQSRGLYRRIVRWRPMAFVGLVSYGVYLWHDVWIVHAIDWTGGDVAQRAPFWPVLLGALGLSVACGAVSYHGVERPLLNLDARRSRRRAGRAEAGMTAAVERLTEGTRRTGTTFDCFDGLRAIAAMSVLLHHASFASGDMVNGRFAHYFTHLDVGVAIFFLISGFLLYRPFVARAFSGRSEPPVRDFLWRRAVRIFPAYWVALAVIIVVFGLQRAIPGGVFGYVQHFGLLHIYDRTHASLGLSQAWTLAVEITFYAFLPLYAALLRRIGTGRAPAARLRLELAALVVLYLAGVAFRAFCYWGPSTLLFAVGVYWLPADLDLFALGMALAVLSAGADVGATPRTLVDRLGRASAAWWAMAAFVFWVVSTRLHLAVGIVDRPNHLKGHANQVCYGLVALFLLIPAVFGVERGGPVRAFLRLRPVAYFGVVSYGVYLWHQAWIGKVVEWQDRPPFRASFFVTVLGALALTFVTAVASWVLLERPLMRWAHRTARGHDAVGARQ